MQWSAGRTAKVRQFSRQVLPLRRLLLSTARLGKFSGLAGIFGHPDLQLEGVCMGQNRDTNPAFRRVVTVPASTR
jgi:hypothetical protein